MVFFDWSSMEFVMVLIMLLALNHEREDGKGKRISREEILQKCLNDFMDEV